MITDIEDFFSKGCGRCARFDTPDCSARQWSSGLEDLRRICRGLKLEETVKWGHPCYMFAGRNIAIIGALRGDFRLTFFNAGLMKDPHGVLERQGPNTRHPDMIRFTGNDQVFAMEDILRSYLEEAMDYARQGLKQPKAEDGLDLPEELTEALDADTELAEAFHALTPGRQRSYVIALGSAKTAQTRINRIARYRDKIIAGKGAMER
ncbi:YdeI/OmpD-associated family protein [uncultured Hoeflea sp.]|uniref:YdeI/OmpD-associated family protein n=1 Tax=uncultured Hoeflea sp. TaxID=538666 RepID=UPI0030D9F6AB